MLRLQATEVVRKRDAVCKRNKQIPCGQHQMAYQMNPSILSGSQTGLLISQVHLIKGTLKPAHPRFHFPKKLVIL
jgi:hypothetical protein